MQRSIRFVTGLAIAAASAGLAQAATWHAWAVNGANTSVVGTTATLSDGPGGGPWSDDATNLARNGGKAFYSTGDFNGQPLSNIVAITGTPVGTSSLPYVNFIVSDGNAAHKGILLMNSLTLGNLAAVNSFTMYESGNSIPGFTDGTTYTYNDVKNLVLTSGGFQAYPLTDVGWALTPDVADGITLLWGNKGNGAEYALPSQVTDANVVAVPEPASLGLCVVGLAGLARRRRTA